MRFDSLSRQHPKWAATAALVCLVALVGCATAPPERAAPPTALDISPVPAQPSPSSLPEGWHHGAFMEIFVRGYADSDGDGIGDLRGLISRLDHLQALGVKGLWLMPVTASGDRDHGYATTDFRAIERDYGTLADFDELLRQAHARGMGVIIDYVINHSAAAHPMFVAARADPTSPWRDWFVWANALPQGWDIWGKNPWYAAEASPWNFKGPAKLLPPAPEGAQNFYFGTFGPAMPDFNFRNPQVLSYHFDSLRFWLNRGLDGFRLDAVPHLIENSAVDWNDQPESRAITKQLQDLIKSYPNRYVVCEATAEPLRYGQPDLCGGAFAFGYTQHFVGAALGQAESVAQLAHYYRVNTADMASFVSNHDIFAGKRLWDAVGGDLNRYKMAAAGYLLQPGTPFIYYGEEVGQAGVADLLGDRPLRAPMSWAPDTHTAGFSTATPFRPTAPNVLTHNVQTERQRPDGLLAFYTAMLHLRNSLPSIARGRFEHSFADDLALGFQRAWGDERTLVLINYAQSPKTVHIPGLPTGASLQRVYPAAGDSNVMSIDARGATVTTLPAQSVQVMLVRR